MPLTVNVDSSQVAALAVALGASVDQVPFALSAALNDAANDVRNTFIQETWPSHVKVRSSGFLRASLMRRFATKTNLEVTIFDALGRGHLELHARGGTLASEGADRLAIPSSTNVRKTARGVVPYPREVPNAVKIGDLIFQAADRRGRFAKPKGRRARGTAVRYERAAPDQRRLRLMYVLKQSVAIPKRVPFYETFATEMTRKLVESLPAAVARAMRTALPRA